MINDFTNDAFMACIGILFGLLLLIGIVANIDEIYGTIQEIIDELKYGPDDSEEEELERLEALERGIPWKPKSKEERRREVKQNRRFRRRFRHWRIGVSFLSHNRERKLLREEKRHYKKARNEIIEEIAHALAIDHIKPVSKGGKTIPSNLRVLCADCNLGKGSSFSPCECN